MKLLEIKKYPDKILRRKSCAIERITEKELALFSDMLFTMRNFSGIGLAAPQVGIARKLIVADIGRGPVLLANPEVLKVKGKDRLQEGCLSVSGALVNIERPYEVVVKGLNKAGKIEEIKASGLLARVLLHEIDHLNGKLIIDYMDLLRKLRFNLCSGRLRRS
jgi:peptide deformylase